MAPSKWTWGVELTDDDLHGLIRGADRQGHDSHRGMILLFLRISVMAKSLHRSIHTSWKIHSQHNSYSTVFPRQLLQFQNCHLMNFHHIQRSTGSPEKSETAPSPIWSLKHFPKEPKLKLSRLVKGTCRMKLISPLRITITDRNLYLRSH